MTDIVIVNWNSGEYLFKCVQSIFGSTNKSFVNKVFIIDNNSSDGSLEKINHNTQIEIIKNPENRGFSKACNQGFQRCTAEYVLLLNPDTQLHPTTLSDCISFMHDRYDVDILGCQLLDDNGNITSSCSRFPKPARFFSDALGLAKIAPSVFKPALLMTDWSHQESRKVDQVMGAFMFIRKNIFDKTGYFDERFFVYYEELDFSKRLAETGGITFFNPEIKTIHSGHGTTANVKSFSLFLNLRSRLQYASKHFTKMGYFTVWICTFCIEPVTRNIFLLLQGNLKQMGQVFKSYLLLLKNKSIKA